MTSFHGFDLTCECVPFGDGCWVARVTGNSRSGLRVSVARRGGMLGTARDAALDAMGRELDRRYNAYGAKSEP